MQAGSRLTWLFDEMLALKSAPSRTNKGRRRPERFLCRGQEDHVSALDGICCVQWSACPPVRMTRWRVLLDPKCLSDVARISVEATMAVLKIGGMQGL